ncbi:hypothetical protein BG006_009533 [Podila minutissima]|uniref:Ion transport domain-containing protein n=1 Tax=Podila minutissima TaxID=64525 RepID=A0A9P5SW24_9FUNG|nr:hypothetical protein BG006_009533 [Podila minutissima]
MKDEKRVNYFYLLLENLPKIAEASRQQPALEDILLNIIQWCYDQAKEKGRPEELRDLIIGYEDKPDESRATKSMDSGKSKSKQRRTMNPDHDFVMVRLSNETTLWKSLGWLVYLQFVPRRHIYVRPRYYRLDVLDNPAIEALVEYKWNAFGYMLWLVRFLAQCGYYLLIVVAAFSQVYSEDPTDLHNSFVAIIVLASWFLFHEIQQFGSSVMELLEIRKSEWLPSTQWYKRQYMPRYLKSHYNWLDLLAFIFPLVASIVQLVNIKDGNPDRAVAELRVFRVVCKYVTIILRILSEIKVFFAVFAIGLLYFSLAIEHVLRGRSSGESRGGRYDPVNEDLKLADNWALHVMIAIYFFFAVILMLNVLIALLNGGFDKAGCNWHLVWLENRLRYVEIAEDMSYRIPGFRQTYDWFPREIYYTATEKQVRRYKDRMPQDEV